MTEHTSFLPEDDLETHEVALNGKELSRLVGTIAAGDTTEQVRFASIVRKSQHPVLRAEQEVALAKTMEIGAFAAHILRLREEAPDEAAAFDHLADPEAPQEFAAELAALAQEGQEARALFAESNTRLVMFQLRRSLSYRKGPIEESVLADVISEGNIGLLRAVDKFDYTKGYKFSTYALKWINKFVNEELDKQGPVELTSYVVQKMKRYRAMVAELTEQRGSMPTTAEMADLLGEANSYIIWLDRMCALAIPYDENPAPGNLADAASAVPQAAFKEPGEDLREVVQENLTTLLHEILDDDRHGKELNDLRVQSVLLHFGITSSDRTPMVARDVAVQLGLTYAQVRQFLAVARDRLRKATEHHQDLKILLQP